VSIWTWNLELITEWVKTVSYLIFPPKINFRACEPSKTLPCPKTISPLCRNTINLTCPSICLKLLDLNSIVATLNESRRNNVAYEEIRLQVQREFNETVLKKIQQHRQLLRPRDNLEPAKSQKAVHPQAASPGHSCPMIQALALTSSSRAQPAASSFERSLIESGGHHSAARRAAPGPLSATSSGAAVRDG